MDTNSVKIVAQADGYTVRVTESGLSIDKSFAQLVSAEIWAAGQAIRLKINPDTVKITEDDDPNSPP